MARILIKLEPNTDWYVLWSTIVDGPIAFGPKADLLKADHDGDLLPERWARADATGSSSRNGWYSWTEDTMVVYSCGTGVLKRADLLAFCQALAKEDTAAAEALLTPFEGE